MIVIIAITDSVFQGLQLLTIAMQKRSSVVCINSTDVLYIDYRISIEALLSNMYMYMYMYIVHVCCNL